MEVIAPLRLADTTWDNVGVMVETPKLRDGKKVLLTIDYTEAVMQEALREEVSVIVAYHPPIFRPMKSLKLSDHKSMLLLHALANGTSIYSPHSALDSTVDGINDWLASGLKPANSAPIVPTVEDAAHGTGRVATLTVGTTLQDLI